MQVITTLVLITPSLEDQLALNQLLFTKEETLLIQMKMYACFTAQTLFTFALQNHAIMEHFHLEIKKELLWDMEDQFHQLLENHQQLQLENHQHPHQLQ